jgi:dihydroorotase
VGLRGIPEASEEVGLTRMIALARATGARVHLSHLTTPRAVSALVAARREGVAVSGAIPARHLLLTDAEVERRGYDSHLRLLPPLRPEAYRACLVEALREGLVEVASSDHQPLTRVEKEHEFQAAEPGAVGLESAFSAVFTALSGDLLPTLRALSSGPASVLGLRAALEVGAPADLALLDLAWEGTIERPRWSRSDNEPLMGVSVRGRVLGTLLAGQPTLPLLQGPRGADWS